MRDGRRIKGLVVDEYRDRIILSTGEGEKTLMKSDIRSVFYSSEEDSLMREAFEYFNRGRLVEAYNVFGGVLELDPDNERARDMRMHIRGSMESSAREKFLAPADREKAGHSDMSRDGTEPRLEKVLGLYLEEGERNVIVSRVEKGLYLSSEGEIELGDRIVKIGGILTAFMDIEEVSSLLMAQGEVKLTVERTVFPELSSRRGILGRILYGRYRNILGAALKLYRQGITVKDVIPGGAFDLAGIRDGDLVLRIEGENTRYMPMTEVFDIVTRNRGRTIEIVIHRDMTIWRKADPVKNKSFVPLDKRHEIRL
jgi:C-terminal processing protease CtpA/Prc